MILLPRLLLTACASAWRGLLTAGFQTSMIVLSGLSAYRVVHNLVGSSMSLAPNSARGSAWRGLLSSSSLKHCPFFELACPLIDLLLPLLIIVFRLLLTLLVALPGVV